MTCSFCPSIAVTEVEGDELIYLCTNHERWTDDKIVRSLQLPFCQDCDNRIATEIQHRKGTTYTLCDECAYTFTIQELRRYERK